ncbi:hypothetical protein T492DRAFT_966944 [Pavlovales sp. CCMP2436]|nr:hypothetical protein T492DRAFT_966944 [Pavlovales sp. CCMP2436]
MCKRVWLLTTCWAVQAAALTGRTRATSFPALNTGHPSSSRWLPRAHAALDVGSVPPSLPARAPRCRATTRCRTHMGGGQPSGGQPGGRVGCCAKAAIYLEGLSSLPTAPLEHDSAIEAFREALRPANDGSTPPDALGFAREYMDYSARPFRVGAVSAAAGERVAASTVLALGRLLHLTRLEAERLHAGLGEDRDALEAFAEVGWEGVDFPMGLPLQWK